jgi:hypothetical protein
LARESRRREAGRAGNRRDHVTVYCWVQRFTPLLAEAARPWRHAVDDRWQVDETYVKVGGTWRHLYRAIDGHDPVIYVLLSSRRYGGAARRFFVSALAVSPSPPAEVVTDKAPTFVGVLADLVPLAFHNVERYANNRIEADEGRLKADRTAAVILAGHAFVQNIHRGHYELGVDAPVARRVARPSPSWPWRCENTPFHGGAPPSRSKQCNRALPGGCRRVPDVGGIDAGNGKG